MKTELTARSLWLPVILTAAALFAGAVFPVAAEEAGAVPTRVVGVRDTGQRVSAEGFIEAVTQAVVAAQISGRVLSHEVDAGDFVKEGQLLLTLDSREAGEAVAAARARQVQADAALARTQDLQRKQFVAAAAVDQAVAEANAARAALQAAEANLSHTRVRAPFAGIVATRQVDVGDLAAPGRALLTLFRPGAMRAVVELPVEEASALRAHRGSLDAVVESAGQSLSVDGTRIQVLPTADATTRGVTVRIDLPETRARGLVPGAAARAMFNFGEQKRITLPADAIVHRGGIAAAYVRDADGRFQLRQLRVGEPVGGGEVEILAGLVEGEVVALDPIKAGIQRRRQAK